MPTMILPTNATAATVVSAAVPAAAFAAPNAISVAVGCDQTRVSAKPTSATTARTQKGMSCFRVGACPSLMAKRRFMPAVAGYISSGTSVMVATEIMSTVATTTPMKVSSRR